MAADPPEKAVPPVRSAHRVALALHHASHNTLVMRLEGPISCQKFEASCFDFDDVFATPTIKGPLDELRKNIDVHPRSRLAIFGHADPDGRPDYNRWLSERRARAVHAILRGDPDAWKALARESGHADAEDALLSRVQAWLCDSALAATAGAPDAKDPLSAYFQALWPEPLDEGRFVADHGYQGCGEFNLVRVAPLADERQMSRSRRLAENAPNRRVVIYVFREDAQLGEARWPCTPAPSPRASTAACEARFWSKEERGKRGNPTHPVHSLCRFYERLTWLSPCEQPGPEDSPKIALFPRWSLDPSTRERSGAPHVARGVLNRLVQKENRGDVLGMVAEAFWQEQSARASVVQIEMDKKWLELNAVGHQLSTAEYERRHNEIEDETFERLQKIGVEFDEKRSRLEDKHEKGVMSDGEILALDQLSRAIFIVDLRLECIPPNTLFMSELRAVLEVRRFGEKKIRIRAEFSGVLVDRTPSGREGQPTVETRIRRFENLAIMNDDLVKTLIAKLPGEGTLVKRILEERARGWDSR